MMLYIKIRDYREGEDRGGNNNNNNNGDQPQQYGGDHRSSMVFSILCMFLTVIYAGFAALTFTYANSIMEEHLFDEREEAMLSTRGNKGGSHFNVGYDGYIGERFDVGVRPRNTTVGPTGFVSPSAPDATLA